MPQAEGDSAVYGIDLVRALDSGSVGRGVVLSCAYLYGSSMANLPAEEVAGWVRRENEFTAAEVAKYPTRLLGFLSVDPRRPSAVSEIEHWRGSKQLVGLKLHLFANDVDVRQDTLREPLKRVLRQAAKQGLPMVIHVGGGSFDSSAAELFIRDVLPAAGRSWVQIAHAAGGGLTMTDHLPVLTVFAEHFARRDPAMDRVLFDISYIPDTAQDDATVQGIARQMRRIGLSRFLFGSDFNVLTPLQEQARLARLQLTEAEMTRFRTNCAPWVCGKR
jgi:predicted TIM-barrel fold metal-dependent hydrolase